MLEKTLESPLDSKEIKPLNCEANQSWIFIGRIHAEAPILWPSDVKSQLITKVLRAGKDRRQEEKRTTGDEMVGRLQWLSGPDWASSRGRVKDREAWHGTIHVSKSQTLTEQLNKSQDIVYSIRNNTVTFYADRWLLACTLQKGDHFVIYLTVESLCCTMKLM